MNTKAKHGNRHSERTWRIAIKALRKGDRRKDIAKRLGVPIHTIKSWALAAGLVRKRVPRLVQEVRAELTAKALPTSEKEAHLPTADEQLRLKASLLESQIRDYEEELREKELVLKSFMKLIELLGR